MIELTPENLQGYLRERGWIGAGECVVTPLSGGVSNVVYRVQSGSDLFVLKQSRGQLRTRAAWFSDLDRIWREQEVMECMRPLLRFDVVPRVLNVDRDNYAFTMSHAPLQAETWKEQLLAGQADQMVARVAGSILGRIHGETTGRADLAARFGDRIVFRQLRIDPFYRRVQERHLELAVFIEPMIERMTSATEAICHGDFSPKNLLLTDKTVTLVDYETAHYGDPAMDLGFFHSHLILKAAYHAPGHAPYLDLVRSAWRAYRSEYGDLMPDTIEARGVGHLAVCLLARIDGTSTVDYLDEPRREAIRQLGRTILQGHFVSWTDALKHAGHVLKQLHR